MHLVRAPEGAAARLGKREIAHLALVDQLFHCAHGILDRHPGVDAMQPVDIDHFHAEALERSITSLRHVTGMTRRDTFGKLEAAQAHVPEFRGEEHAVAFAFDRRSEEHTSELQSQSNLVCRLLLEKKK